MTPNFRIDPPLVSSLFLIFYRGSLLGSTNTKPSDVAEHYTFCRKDKHSREGCFKRIGYPEWWSGNQKWQDPKPKATCIETNPIPIPGLKVSQYETFLKNFEEKGGTIKDDTNPKAYVTCKRERDDDWVVYSGSTKLVTHNINILENKTRNHFEKPILIPNGDAMSVEGRGKYILLCWTKIKGVLHLLKFNCIFE